MRGAAAFVDRKRRTTHKSYTQLNFNFNIHPTSKEKKTVVDNYATIILMLNGATTVEIEISVKV